MDIVLLNTTENSITIYLYSDNSTPIYEPIRIQSGKEISISGTNNAIIGLSSSLTIKYLNSNTYVFPTKARSLNNIYILPIGTYYIE